MRLSRRSAGWTPRPVLPPLGWSARWLARSVARQAGASVFFTLCTGAILLWYLLHGGLLPGLSPRAFLLGTLVVVPAVTASAAWVTTRFLGARLGHLISVIDG